MIEIGSRNPEKIAADIIQLPDGYDLGKEKGLQDLLLTIRDPLRYAAIFRAVANHPNASRWMQFAGRVEEINGKRRATGANAPELVVALSKIVEEGEREIPSGKEKYALLANVRYNEGILNRQPRSYLQGAATQRQASAWYGLAGNREWQYTALFVSAVEEVSAAFSSDDETLKRALDAMVSARDLIKATFLTMPVWMVKNAPTHIVSAIVLANLMSSGLYTADYSADLQEASGTDMVHWNKFFAVWQAFSEKRFSDVVASVPSVVESSSLDNARLGVQVLVALAEIELGKNDEAKTRLETVANHAGLDGGMPIAVAKRLV